MCAKEQTGDADGEETVSLFARIPREDKEALDDYAEAHGLSNAAAISQIIQLITGGEAMPDRVRAMDEKLDRVLDELEAPGIGSEISADGVAADGATRAKIDYDELGWNHTEELSRDEADWSTEVKQTPSARVPVARGILLDELTRKEIEKEQLSREITEIYGCAPQTAEGYVETGEHKSWYPNPWMDLERSDELETLTEILEEGGASLPRRVERYSDILSGTVDMDGESTQIWRDKTTVNLTERIYTAQTRQMVARLRDYVEEHPRSGKGKLMLVRALAYGRDNGVLTPPQVDEIHSELREEEIELPSRWW